MKIEAKINEKLSACPKTAGKHFKRLLTEMLKHNDCIGEIYRSLLLEDFLSNITHIYDVASGLQNTILKSEQEIIEPFFAVLPEDSQEYFRELIASDGNEWDLLFGIFLDQIRNLVVTDVSFFESVEYSNERDKRDKTRCKR
jgi:hypothetical protein